MSGDTDETIREFDFSSGSRGRSHNVTIRKDSAFIETINRIHRTDSKKTRIKINNTDWENLKQAISGSKFTELVNLPSPSNNRSFDGASISVITIQTNRSSYRSGEFDDYNPNARLTKLIQIMQEIENRK
jgi:hypothetical protein